MLKGYKILTSFCVICATLYGGAYGAASVRGGATSRAGSIRTLGAGTTASVKATTSRTQPTTTAANANTESAESVGGMRMSHATGLGGSKLPGKISGTTTSTSGDNQNVAELRQAIEQLRNDYDALGEQYNNLLGDVSNVSDTAQVAHETATNNTNTLTVVRSDLSVAKSDIEDLKATGGFDEERVQEALDTTLAQRNYATRGELAATDAVARGAVQVADLPQTLNALNIADKDYVASRTQGVVNDSLNITLENYYTKGQVNAAIDVAKTGMVDKNYVDNQIDGLAPKTYVDNRVASIQTGVSEGAVQGIINNSIDTRLENYYTKGDIDNAIVDAIDAAKVGMADRDYVNTQVRDTMEYVDEKVGEIESGVDTGTLYNILETRGYKTGTEVQGIVNDSINNTVANYYTKSQVDNAINVAKNGMADRNYVDNQIDGLAPKNWVNTVVDAKVNALPLGLGRDAVKAVVEEYGYKDDAAVRNILAEYNYAKADDIPNMIAELAPGADIQYDSGVLTFKDKNGNPQTVDIRGLDGQDGAQVELQKNGDKIQWRYESDTAWHDLVNVSDLRGADGKSVELGVQTMTVGGMPIKDALVYKKDGENNWQFLYNLDNIAGADGCGIKVETNDYVSGGALLGKTVKLLRDCPASSLDGAQLTSFNVLNGADGTVSEEQIVGALESNPTFMQLKKNVQDLSDGLNNTNSQVNELSDKVDNNTTGLVATNTLANNAWNKVKDLESSNKTAREYVDDRIGDLGFDLLTRRNYASVAAKLGEIDDTKTVAEYINAQISKINTSIRVESGDDGITYICKTGNNCTTNPNPYTGDWARISVDVSGYLTRAEADDSFAPIGIVGAVTTAQDAASQAQTQASQAWGKLSDLGGDTVKGYVDNTINGRVGFLGINLHNGKDYSVADKLGFTATPGTVKEYIDKAVSSVNTKIRVERSPYDGKTYICKNGDACTSQPGPYSTDEWVPVSVDMSGYLTQNDADNRYATITELNGVQATANEAKTAATAAQTNATQAQNAANSAQSTANDAWGKLSDLGNTTVREFVEDKVSGLGTTIDVRTVGGTTYICKVGKCLDTPPSDWWEPITVTISDEYLTETEGNALYALKTQIGDLGGSFASVGAKIGLNDYQYGNTTVKDYVDNQVSNISTTIQVETGTDGFTYICRTGSNCHLPIASYSSEWAKVNVDLSSINTILNGFGGNNQPANVKNYIDTSIGSLGYSTNEWGQQTPYSVLTYLQANYVPRTKLGPEITGNTTQTVAQYITQRIGDTGTVNDYSGQSRPKTVVEFVNGKIGNLNSYENVIAYGNANYAPKSEFDTLSSTVSGHTTLLTGLGNGVTVKDYVDSKTPNIQIAPGSNGKMYYCTLATRCNTDYLDTAHGWQEFDISESLNLSTYLKVSDAANTYLTIADAANTYASKTVESAVNNETTGLSATRTLASNASVAAATADTKAGNAATAAATAQGTADTANTTANKAWDRVKSLGKDVNGDDYTTVAGRLGFDTGANSKTVKQYIDDKVADVKPTIMTETYQGTTYICSSGNCTNHAPNTGWEELSVDLSALDAIEAILDGFGGEDEPEKVKQYVDNKFGNLGTYVNDNGQTRSYSVENKLGLPSDYANKTVTKYIVDRLGFTDDDADKTVAEYVAEHAASGGSFDSSVLNGYATEDYVRESIGNLGTPTGSDTSYTVAGKIGSIPAAQTIKEYIDNNMPSIDVRPGTADADKNKLYICTKPSCDTGNIPGATDSGWVELDIASAINLSLYLTKDEAARTYLPQTGLKLHRNGRSIELQQVSGETVVKNYGPIAEVQDLMCDSYRMVQLEEGDDGYDPGAISYTMICNTNGND